MEPAAPSGTAILADERRRPGNSPSGFSGLTFRVISRHPTMQLDLSSLGENLDLRVRRRINFEGRDGAFLKVSVEKAVHTVCCDRNLTTPVDSETTEYA